MTAYEKNRQIVMEALESYRDMSPDDGKRKFVDWLMKRSLKVAQNDLEGKKYHNLIVLRYLSVTERSKKKICDALHIGRACKTTHKGRKVQCYEAVTDNAIDRLLILAFGVGGIDWDSPHLPQVESKDTEIPPENVLVELITEFIGLKYSITAKLLTEMQQQVKESTELSSEMRSRISDAIKTVQAQLVLNAVFGLDPFPSCSKYIKAENPIGQQIAI